MEKFYLGMSFSHNSSACVVSSERGVLAAISQERLNGEKNTKELPFEAALKCCEIAGVTDIECAAVSHYETISKKYLKKHGEKYNLHGKTWRNMIKNYFNGETNVCVKDVTTVHHHTAHAMSVCAFYENPKRDDYIITSDGFGDGLSASIIHNGEVIDFVRLERSVGLIYQFVTGALGFTELKHEGKITGLAAFGEPKYVKEFGSIELEELTPIEKFLVKKSFIIDFDKFLGLKKAVYALVKDLLAAGAKREDIAASVQDYAERVTCEWICENVHEKGKNCYLSGGLFANVKINQRVKELGIFKNVYVCPAMGDEGNAIGAAYTLLYDFPETKISPNQCGTVANEGLIVGESDKYSCRRIADDDELAKTIAEMLSENKIVCLVKGKMEFGPRALCHRSILYNCDSKETNTWLNDKLGRTEFMPFAPVCREEDADDLFLELDGGRDSAKYMTMTFDCTPEFIEDYPAACHIDNTARPQIVSQDEDPFIWSVLSYYQLFTGKKALINTSFNLHNNPIIESTEVAVNSWITSGTDVLVIGNTILEVNK